MRQAPPLSRRQSCRQGPKKGDEAPHSRFCAAIASENVYRPVPSSFEIGTMNIPKTWRIPSVTVTIQDPAINTITQGANIDDGDEGCVLLILLVRVRGKNIT